MFFDTALFALKRLIHSPLYSFINIVGLGVALACVILVALYVEDETSFDSFWPQAENIYRLDMRKNLNNGDTVALTRTYAPVVPLVRSNIADVAYATRLGHFRFLVNAQERRFYENVLFADPEVVNVFGFKFIAGDPSSAFLRPYSLVLTESVAGKLFPETKAIDQIVWLDGKHKMQVSGVIEDIPLNSHLEFAIFSNISTAETIYGTSITDWSYASKSSYLLLKENASAASVENQLNSLVESNIPDDLLTKLSFELQPIVGINLHDGDGKGLRIVYIISFVAVLILFMACANVVNLATARGAERTKELGVRKAVGASRWNLGFQFIIESIILSFFALLFALISVVYMLPVINSMTHKALALSFFHDVSLVGWLVLLCLLTGVLSGGYPAYVLSKFKPAHVLKGNMKFGQGSILIRTFIVVLQFSISVGLVIVTITMFKQVNFIKNMDLNFDKDNVVVIGNINWTDIKPHYETLKAEFSQHPAIRSISGSTGIPGKDFDIIGSYVRQGESDSAAATLYRLDIDYQFFDTYGVKMAAGRMFSKAYANDLIDFSAAVDSQAGRQEYNVIINESAVRKLGFESPEQALNQRLERLQPSRWAFSVKIVGVVEDFHLLAGQGPIHPYIYIVNPENFAHASIKLSGNNIAAGISHIDAVWNKVIPQYPIVRSFIDDNLDKSFQQWENYSKVMITLTFITIIIASFGAFGLVSYATKYRKKEICVRKVVGASAFAITRLFTLEFCKLVLISNVIAWPVAYIFAQRWLSEFSYRIEIEGSLFLTVGFVSIVITLIVTSYHTLKVANTKPAQVFHHN